MGVSVPIFSQTCKNKGNLTDKPKKPVGRYDYYTIQIMMVCLMLSYFFMYYKLSWTDNGMAESTLELYTFHMFIAVTVILILSVFIYAITNNAIQYINQLYTDATPIPYAKWGENSLRNTRIIGIIYSICSLIIYHLKSPYTTYLVVFRFFSLSNALIVYFCTLHKMVRTTFRRWPNHIISIGAALGYLALAELFNAEDKLLGVFSFHITTGVDHIKAMNIPIGEIIGAIGLTIVLIEAYKKSISGISEDDPSTVIQGRKRTRRKLLTHWNYKQYKIIFSGENAVVWFLSGCFLYALFFLFAISESNEDAVYITIVSCVFYLSGLMAHWSIETDRLIQSEHSYLLFSGLKLSVNDVRESTPKWKDYCQVLMSLYANVCGINSEDDYYHKLDMLLINISDGFSQDLCVHEKFLSDILKAKGDTNPQLMRDAPLLEKEQDVAAAPKSSDLQKAQDILFSNDLCKVLSHYREPSKKIDPACRKSLGEYDPLDLMLLATNLFFDGREDSWELRLSKCGIGSEDGIHLLKIDTLIRMLQMYSQKECGLFWLQCAQHRQCTSEKPDHSDRCTSCLPSICRNIHQDKEKLDEYNAIRKYEIASSLVMDNVIMFLTEDESVLSNSNLMKHITPQLLEKLNTYLANLGAHIDQNMRSNASIGSPDRFNGIKELQEWVKNQDGTALLFDELIKVINVHTNTNFQDTCLVSRMELLVNYPLFVKQSFESRWEQSYDDVLFAEDGLEYFYELFECELFADSTKQCNMAVERIMKRLSEHSEVSAYLQAFSQKLESKHSDMLSKARIEHAKCKCNRYTEDSKWEDFASHFVHLAEDGKRKEDAKTILTEKIHLPVATLGIMIEGPKAEMKPYPRAVYYLFCPIEGG